MIGLQFVRLHITPLVITFHRRDDNVGTKKGKNRGKRAEQGTGRQRETDAGKGDEEKGNLYYAELGASCFCPHFLVFLIRQAAESESGY